jgi:hypothetical protein
MARISIKPEREYLREIAAKLQDGTYAIPAFQREYVWKKQQILDLFDSISKGYPIGSIILWKPKDYDIPPARDVITEEIAHNVKPEYYILDGRQRTTTFYGCVSDLKDKPEEFQLYYDLDEDSFVYKNKRNVKKNIYEVSNIYDTFKMLGLLQDISNSGLTEEKTKLYINRIKEINTILQTYEIGEMIIENCTLEESSTVFSRINSKGTDISKMDMLQALTYKNKESVLVSEEIEKITKSLSEYGFGSIKPDDILNCCYTYIGHNFYDNKVLEFLMKADMAEVFTPLKQHIVKAVEFLYIRCGVIDYKILPYSRQLTAVHSFFKTFKNPSEEQLVELEKWFFYTTYQQTFQNSSLGIIRPVFRRFEEFLNGEKNTAIDYEKIDLDTKLNFKFASGSAASNFITMCQVLLRRESDAELNLYYCGEYYYNKGNKPASAFALLTSDDRSNIKDILEGNKDCDDLSIYFLSEEMLVALSKQKDSVFFHLRRQRIVSEVRRKLESYGFDVVTDANENAVMADFDIKNLLDEFEYLNNAERIELCEVLQSQGAYDSLVFHVGKPSEENGIYSIEYPSFNAKYHFDAASSQVAIKRISEQYCGGEDPVSFYDWLIALDKND